MPGLVLILKSRAPQERFEWPPWQAQSVLLFFRSDPKASLPLQLVMACQEGLQLKLEASASISQCCRMWLLQDTPSRASPKLPLVPFIVTINFSFYSLVCLWNDVIWGRRSLPEVSTIHSQTKGSVLGIRSCAGSLDTGTSPWASLSQGGSVYPASMPAGYVIFS